MIVPARNCVKAAVQEEVDLEDPQRMGVAESHPDRGQRGRLGGVVL